MWRLWGFHLLLLSDIFHLSFSVFQIPPKKYLKKTELCTIMSAYIWMNYFFSSIMDSTLTRASDRSRKKKSNFVGFLGTNSRKNRPTLREFRGSFLGKLHQKAIGKKQPILWLFQGKFPQKLIGFAPIRTAFLTFF